MAEPIFLSNREVSLMDSFLNSLPNPSEADLLPALGAEMKIPCVGRDVNILQDVSGDAAPVQLLQQDYLLTEAARTILCIAIAGNALNVKHFRWIVKNLREGLLQAGEAALHEISHREAYAVILTHFAERLTTLDSESALSVRPLSYVECLDTLIENIESAFIIMKQSGLEPDVFVMNDKEPVGYSERLCSLASHLRGDN